MCYKHLLKTQYLMEKPIHIPIKSKNKTKTPIFFSDWLTITRNPGQYYKIRGKQHKNSKNEIEEMKVSL